MTALAYSKNYENFLANLISAPFSRLAKTFKTTNYGYLYDLGTGKVLQCEDNVYSLLKLLEKGVTLKEINLLDSDTAAAVEVLMEAYSKENVLQAKPVTSLSGKHTSYLENPSNYKINHLCFEVTQRCNLRCSYCIYHDNNTKFRDFGQEDMDFSVAKKAIDYVFEYGNSEKLVFGFYGGEPLIKFDLIKACVDYIKSKGERETFFSLTTNGTLLTKEMAEYFASMPNFALVFSLDGDKQSHDEHRLFKNGGGTFDAAFRGFNYALDAYKDSALLSINAVISPPYDNAKLERLQKFFKTTLGDNIQLQYTYAEYNNPIDDNNYLSVIEEATKTDRSTRSPLLVWQQKSNVNEKESLFTWSGVIHRFLFIHNRLITDEPISWYIFNGCCIPGGRKLYLSTDGNYHVCERVGNAPPIGNINDGLRYDIIKKEYIEDYMNKSLHDCNACWAANLCGLCYSHCYDDNGFNLAKKRVECGNQRFSIEEMLVYYHQILEENPESLEFLNTITMR